MGLNQCFLFFQIVEICLTLHTVRFSPFFLQLFFKIFKNLMTGNQNLIDFRHYKSTWIREKMQFSNSVQCFGMFSTLVANRLCSCLRLLRKLLRVKILFSVSAGGNSFKKYTFLGKQPALSTSFPPQLTWYPITSSISSIVPDSIIASLIWHIKTKITRGSS